MIVHQPTCYLSDRHGRQWFGLTCQIRTGSDLNRPTPKWCMMEGILVFQGPDRESTKVIILPGAAQRGINIAVWKVDIRVKFLKSKNHIYDYQAYFQRKVFCDLNSATSKRWVIFAGNKLCAFGVHWSKYNSSTLSNLDFLILSTIVFGTSLHESFCTGLWH